MTTTAETNRLRARIRRLTCARELLRCSDTDAVVWNGEQPIHRVLALYDAEIAEARAALIAGQSFTAADRRREV